MNAPTNRPEYLQRMYVEVTRLGLKLALLNVFIDSDKSSALDSHSRYLLRLQQKAMTDYFEVLGLRIERAEMMEARKQ